MRHLSGLDASFLAVETAEQPMTCSRLALIRSPAGADLDAAMLADWFERAAASHPVLRHRPVAVPAGIHHPAWVDAGPTNSSDHIIDATAGGPATLAELDPWVARILEHRLPRDRPLWSAHLVRDLEPGLSAVLLRTHHALLDGHAFLEILDALAHPEHHDRADATPGTPGARSAGASTRAAVLRSGVGARGRVVGRLPGLVGRSAAGVARVSRFRRHSSSSLPLGYTDAPPTRLDGVATGHLGYGRLNLSLDELRFVMDASGATLTEVLLAIVAGGLRNHLRRLGTVPEEALLANVPVSLDLPGRPARTWGNNTSSVRTSLATDHDDPWARLATIGAATREARQQHAHLGRELMRDWRDQVVPGVGPSIRRVAGRADARRQRHDRKLADVNVTAQRGPEGPLTFGPHRIEAMYLCGPKVAGIGPNISAVSYAGRLHVAVLVDAAYVPDVAVLVDDLSAAHDELVAEAPTVAISRSSSRR